MRKIGLVDFDTSHVVQFTKRLNHIDIDEDQWVDGGKVVMGYPGTSRVSPERVPGYTEELREMGVQIVDSPADMIGSVDAVFVESNEGGAHLGHAKQFLEAGLPLFIDKPYAANTAQARAIAELASQNGVPIFSASSLRYVETIVELQAALADEGGAVGAYVHSPGSEHYANPGLLNYGIHGVEMLYAAMGPGCQEVWAVRTEGADVVTGRWDGDRLGTVRAIREGGGGYGITVYSGSKVHSPALDVGNNYRNLLREIMNMLETGEPPLAIEETIEIISFIEAAYNSTQNGGARTALETAS
jgi:hypothetical protein